MTNISNNLNTFNENFLNQYVLIRTYSAGVHIGTLHFIDNDKVILKNSRRIHYWNEACSCSQIARDGIQDKVNSRVAVAVDFIWLPNVIEIIKCSDKAIQDLKNFPEWKV